VLCACSGDIWTRVLHGRQFTKIQRRLSLGHDFPGIHNLSFASISAISRIV
jgi:hypothetical protein